MSTYRPRVAYFYDSEIGNYHYGVGHPMKVRCRKSRIASAPLFVEDALVRVSMVVSALLAPAPVGTREVGTVVWRAARVRLSIPCPRCFAALCSPRGGALMWALLMTAYLLALRGAGAGGSDVHDLCPPA
jgi:hypothetical protein